MRFLVHIIEQNASLDNMCAVAAVVADRHNCYTMEHKARKIHLNDIFVSEKKPTYHIVESMRVGRRIREAVHDTKVDRVCRGQWHDPDLQ